MNKQKMTPVGIVIAVLILLLVAVMVRSGLKQPEHIILPPEGPGESAELEPDRGLDLVEIRPDTVQNAISVMKRSGLYARKVYVERFWEGGSAVTETDVYASGGWTRLETLPKSSDSCHRILTPDGEIYVWYGADRNVYHGAQALSQDVEQGILTYEDILTLPTGRILAAEYVDMDGVSCIYVETQADAKGCVERYWVSTENGLLHAAQRELDGVLFYRMTTEELAASVSEKEFTLPDGTVLYIPAQPAAAAQNEKAVKE